MGLDTITEDLKKKKETEAKTETKPAARGLLDVDSGGMLQLFDNFKLIYRNASGQRVGESARYPFSWLFEVKLLANPLQKRIFLVC